MRGDVTDAGRTITEDRATQPMEAGGWVSQKLGFDKILWFFCLRQLYQESQCIGSLDTVLKVIA